MRLSLIISYILKIRSEEACTLVLFEDKMCLRPKF